MGRVTQVFIVFFVSFILLGVSFSWAKVYKFTYATFMPPTHHQSKLTEAWCKEIEKRTHGRVKFTYYPGGTLVKAPQIYDGVISGRVDVGTSCLLYTRGRFPLMDVINLNKEWVIKHGKDWDEADYEGARYTLMHGNEIIGIPYKEAKRWKKG